MGVLRRFLCARCHHRSTPSLRRCVTLTIPLQGSCPGEPSSTLEGAAALPQRTTPTQCVLRVPAGLLSAVSAERGSVETPRLWLDNLFLTTATGPEPPSSASNRTALRVQQRSSDAVDGAVQLTIGSRSEAWLTNIVLEVGHGYGPAARGIDVQSAASLYTRSATLPAPQTLHNPLPQLWPNVVPSKCVTKQEHAGDLDLWPVVTSGHF